MAKKCFHVIFEVTVDVEIDDAVFDAVNDEWRSMFYNLWHEEDIVEHISRNIVANQMGLSDMDGWADQPDSNVKLLDEDWYLTEYEKK
jgi:hypothetical protein